MNSLTHSSLIYFKHFIYKKYENKKKRVVFESRDFYSNGSKILKEYPVILSTTYSSRSSLCNKAEFDYLIMNEAFKKIVLVIEVDDYKYHKKGTKQAERDAMKSAILERYGIPYLRFATNGSGEKEMLINALDKY